MTLDIALAIACRTEELGELNLETSILVETSGLSWQLELEEIMVYRAREAARSLAKQLGPHNQVQSPFCDPEFVPLADAIDQRPPKRRSV